MHLVVSDKMKFDPGVSRHVWPALCLAYIRQKYSTTPFCPENTYTSISGIENETPCPTASYTQYIVYVKLYIWYKSFHDTLR